MGGVSLFINLLTGAIVIGGIYGLIGLGYSLIYRASGLMSFAQGDLLMIGAFIGLTLFKTMGLPYAVSVAISFLLMFLLGIALEKFAIRPILNKGGKAINVVLITIGISIVLQNIAVVTFSADVQMFPSIFKSAGLNVGGFIVSPESILSICVALVCMVLLHLFMAKTRLGTAMRAAAQDETAASAYGVNVSLVKGLTWGIATALAGIAGLLIGPVYGVYSSMGTSIGLKGFAAAVIGGYGDMYGAILGGFALGMIETFAGGYISSQAKEFVVFLVLILFLVVKPSGFFNAKIIED